MKKTKNQSGTKTAIKLPVSILKYQDKKLFHVYCPELNLVGYGKTETEAEKTFKIVSEEYFRYAEENGTLFADLSEFGWTGIDSPGSVTPPSWMNIYRSDEVFREIVSDYDYTKTRIEIKLKTS